MFPKLMRLIWNAHDKKALILASRGPGGAEPLQDFHPKRLKIKQGLPRSMPWPGLHRANACNPEDHPFTSIAICMLFKYVAIQLFVDCFFS